MNVKPRSLSAALLAAIAIMFATSASAQEQETPTNNQGITQSGTAAQGPGDIRAADTSSPRDTLRSFIDACNELHQHITAAPGYYDRANPEHVAIAERVLDCIDDSELPTFARTDRAGEAAVCLKEILDRVALPPWDQIPDMAEIVTAGGREKLPAYRIPDTRITISLVEQGPRRLEYLFSPGTVDRAPGYFKSIEAKPYRTEDAGKQRLLSVVSIRTGPSRVGQRCR